MDLGSLGKREQIARERIEASVAILARRFGLSEQAVEVNKAHAQARDPRLAAMLRAEAVAVLLEQVCKVTDSLSAAKPARAKERQ